MAVEDVREVLGRAAPAGASPLSAGVLAGIAPPRELRAVRDALIDLGEEVTLDGAEDEDLRGELINEGDLLALADVAARLCEERPDVAATAGAPLQDLGRMGATYQALGQVERAADPLQLAAHTAVLLLSAELTRQNDLVRDRVAEGRAAAVDVTTQRVLDALFGNEGGLRSGVALSAEERRQRVRLLDEQGARAVSAALQEAGRAQAAVRGAALREAPLPAPKAPSLKLPGAAVAAKAAARGKGRKVRP